MKRNAVSCQGHHPHSRYKIPFFSDAQLVTLEGRLPIRVIPLVLLMLIKIVAFSDIRSLMSRYEADSDRLFSDAVLDAKLSDFSLANAYLLGLDLRSMYTEE